MKLHKFTGENISSLFLSPYVETQFGVEGVLFRSELFGTSASLAGERRDLEEVIELLENGVKDSVLREFLQSRFHVDGGKFVAGCMAKGIIE